MPDVLVVVAHRIKCAEEDDAVCEDADMTEPNDCTSGGVRHRLWKLKRPILIRRRSGISWPRSDHVRRNVRALHVDEVCGVQHLLDISKDAAVTSLTCEVQLPVAHRRRDCLRGAHCGEARCEDACGERCDRVALHNGSEYLNEALSKQFAYVSLPSILHSGRAESGFSRERHFAGSLCADRRGIRVRISINNFASCTLNHEDSRPIGGSYLQIALHIIVLYSRPLPRMDYKSPSRIASPQGSYAHHSVSLDRHLHRIRRDRLRTCGHH